MLIYNTLTRKKEEFVPIKSNKAGIYVCGATVYNKIHLGNARPMVVFDVLRRHLQARGYDVEYITNFTDVDDKIIALANAESVEAAEVAERYVQEALADAEGLGCLRATAYPRVTEEMDGIIRMIGAIIEHGYAYADSGTVFFDTAAKEDYGKLSGRNLEDLEAGARVEVDERKKNASDFVLWKPAKDGEPYWDSPWGRGRPGWHIECSQMIKRYLGSTADIHAGGADLIFPHHENEIAQSEAANATPLANYWMHNGMINVEDEKMSKSEGNFFLVRELAERFGYDTLRFYILSVHYRSPISFSYDNVQAAGNGLNRIRNCRTTLREAAGSGQGALDADTAKRIDEFKKLFYDALDDDLNTANAISVIFDLVKYSNTNGKEAAADLLSAIDEMCGILGLKTEEEPAGTDDGAVLELIGERNAARAAKDWKRSDELRDRLKDMGVAVKDTADGTKWYYERKS